MKGKTMSTPEETFSEILEAAVQRGWVTQMERHILAVEVGPEAVQEVANAAHRAKVIKNGGKVFNV